VNSARANAWATEFVYRLLPADPRGQRELALFLDVDGTLVGFSPTPVETTISSELRALLDTLTQQLDGAVSIVSGRSMRDLDRLFPAPAFARIGAHGGEIRTPAGLLASAAAPDPAVMTEVRVALQRAVASEPRLYFEDKGVSVALHYRRAPDCEPMVRQLVSELAQTGSGLRIQWGAAVAELRGDSFDKGTAVEALRQRAPFRGRLPLYFGDDDTDLPALQHVASAGGRAVAVGPRLSATSYQHLAGPTDVCAVLHALSAALANTDAAAGGSGP